MALVMSGERESSKLSDKRSYKTCVSGECAMLEKIVMYQFIDMRIKKKSKIKFPIIHFR